MKFKLFTIIFLSIAISSCSDDDFYPVEALGDYVDGLLITNQGPFNNGSGSISYINSNLTDFENEVYQNVNGTDPGNVVNAIGFAGNFAYIIANVSNRITVVDRNTLREVDRIEVGLDNPRFFTAINNKGYVSNWGDPTNPSDDYIAVIDLITNEVINKISVNEGPEKIARARETVYVLHQGGYGVNNEISIIDTNDDSVVSTLTVGDVPNSYGFEANGNLWVLSGGAPSYTGNETGGSIAVINTITNEISERFDFETEEHPSFINVQNGVVYYYLNNELFQASTVNFDTTEEVILSDLNFFNMKVIGNAILGVDAKDFNSNGDLIIYNLSTLDVFNTIELGIIPDQIYLN